MIRRRAFLLSTTAAIPLGACAGFNVDKGIADLLAYGKALYNGAKSMWAQLQANPLTANLISADNRNTITVTGRAIGAVLEELSAAQSTAQAQPIVAKLGTYVRAVLSAFVTIPGLPPAVLALLAAAQIVLPVLESLVGIGIATAQQVQDAVQARNALAAAPTN